MLSAVVTLTPSDAAQAIWAAIPAYVKIATGLNDDDYRKLAMFLAALSRDGYAIQRYDDPSQVPVMSDNTINAEVRRLGSNIYAAEELDKAVRNVKYIMGLGFGFTKNPSAPMATVSLSLPTGTGDATVGDFFKSLAAGFNAYSPLMSANQNARLQAAQTKIDQIRQRNAAMSTPPRTDATKVVPWLMGAAAIGLFGFVIYGVIRKGRR